VDIPAHEGVAGIARRLREADVVRSPETFIVLSVLRGTARALRAGEYEFPRGTTLIGALRLLESGKVRLHAVLHPEGGTVAEFARTLEQQQLARAADVVRLAGDPAFLRSVGIDAPTLEGYIFPDTYQVTKGMTPEQILTRMVQRLRTVLTPAMLARARDR